jgi:hypothetical protein
VAPARSKSIFTAGRIHPPQALARCRWCSSSCAPSEREAVRELLAVIEHALLAAEHQVERTDRGGDENTTST